jgi:iron complex outermembrane receptor protein
LSGGIVQDVSSYTTVDLGFTFNIGDPKPTRFFDGGLSFGIDLLNILDSGPPYVNLAPSVNGSGGYDASAASPLGREIAVTVRKKF